ncbi:MAG: class II aldolase/adducin family protein [Dehalococcoidia bacterium]
MATLETRDRPARYSEEEWQARVDLAAAYRLAAHFGYAYLIYNHITMRVPGTEHFLINQFGLRYDEMTASSLVKLDLNGNVIDGPEKVNVPGFVIHSAIHGARHDVQCVMHTHTPYGMTVSSLQCGLVPLTQDGMSFYNRVAYHDYEGLSVDVDERERLVTDLGNHDALILRNHGLLTVGRSVGEAFVNMYNLERACQVQVQAMSTGQPLNMPPHEVCERAARQLTSRSFAGDEWEAYLRLLDSLDPSYRD